MTIIICPGIHAPELTEQFVQGIQNIIGQQRYLIFPADQYPAYSAIAIDNWLKHQSLSPSKTQPLSFIAFSAGVVGSIGAAWGWELQGGKINYFIAFDGWGIPLIGNFPIYRVSHDHFTHWSSSITEDRIDNFYAEPQVTHLELWRSPQGCWGWQTIAQGQKTRITLNNYLTKIIV